MRGACIAAEDCRQPPTTEPPDAIDPLSSPQSGGSPARTSALVPVSRPPGRSRRGDQPRRQRRCRQTIRRRLAALARQPLAKGMQSGLGVRIAHWVRSARAGVRASRARGQGASFPCCTDPLTMARYGQPRRDRNRAAAELGRGAFLHSSLHPPLGARLSRGIDGEKWPLTGPPAVRSHPTAGA
jgi:hypothetical protein